MRTVTPYTPKVLIWLSRGPQVALWELTLVSAG
jgi:hypothetical protein